MRQLGEKVYFEFNEEKDLAGTGSLVGFVGVVSGEPEENYFSARGYRVNKEVGQGYSVLVDRDDKMPRGEDGLGSGEFYLGEDNVWGMEALYKGEISDLKGYDRESSRNLVARFLKKRMLQRRDSSWLVEDIDTALRTLKG